MEAQAPAAEAVSVTEILEKLPVEQLLAKLTVQASRGLSNAEAQEHLAMYGPNALVEKEKGLAARILGYFTGPIAYMIEAAAVVSAVIGYWDDFAIITALLVFNAALELWQDHQASAPWWRSRKGWRPKQSRCVTTNGRRWQRRCWFQATSSRSAWARSFPRICGWSRAITRQSARLR